MHVHVHRLPEKSILSRQFILLRNINTGYRHTVWHERFIIIGNYRWRYITVMTQIGEKCLAYTNKHDVIMTVPAAKVLRVVALGLCFTQIRVHGANVITNVKRVTSVPDAHFNFNTDTRYAVYKSRIQCVAECKRAASCLSVNAKRRGSLVECQFQERATKNLLYLESSTEHVYYCKIHIWNR